MTRHELKEQLQHDEFKDAVSNVVTYTQSHRQLVIRWAIIGAAVVLIAAGVWAFLNYQKGQRQHDLAEAMSIVDAQVGPPNDPVKTFPTEQARDEAAQKALADVAAKDGDSNEGMIARYYVATYKAKQDQASAAADFQKVADSGSSIAPLAKIALAQIYVGQNKVPQAQDLLRSIINNPTDLVSKAQAQVLLAQTEAAVNPQDSKATLKMVSADDQKRKAVSQAVDAVSAQLK